ncbi:MAG: hypothetical protein AAF789_03310, partial [Bacteroidota bacterium]
YYMEKLSDDMNADKNTPQWLKTIQLNSWEAELLVSALVLYTLFQIPDILQEWSYSTFSRGSRWLGFFNVAGGSIYILQFGYALHIMIRGTWVASVGFSYVFPEGIKDGNLKFKGKFRKELRKNPSLVSNVLFLEKLSSMIYGLTFTIFGLIIGVVIFFFLFISAERLLNPNSPGSITDNIIFLSAFTIIFSFFALVVLFNFVSGDLLKRKEWAVDWYYYVSKIYSVLTLAFIYRRSLLVLQSNIRGWKARTTQLIMTLLVVGIYFVFDEIGSSKAERYYAKTQSGVFASNNYLDLLDEGDYYIATIPSDIITTSYLRFDIKDARMFSELFNDPFDRDQIKWNQQSGDTTSMFLNRWLSVRIGSKEYDSIKWMKSQHSVNMAFGFHTYLDLEKLQRGEHRLIVKFDTARLSRSEKQKIQAYDMDYEALANIAFVYDK